MIVDDYFVRSYLRVSADLLAVQDYETAETAIAEATRQRPGNISLLKRLAEIADRLKKPAAALLPLLERYEGNPWDSAAHLDLCAKLLPDLNRADDAAALLEDAVVRFPTDMAVLRALAWATGVKGDREAAMRHYRRAIAYEPDSLNTFLVAVSGARDLGYYDEADELLRARRPQFGTDHGFLVVSAWVAHFRGDWPEAMRRWEFLRDRFPDEVTCDWMIGRILAEHLQRPDEADAILAACIARHPTDLRLLREYARLPTFNGQWALSLKRWQDLAAIYPDDTETVTERGRAELQIQIHAIDSGVGDDAVLPPDDTGLRDLFLGFESMGLNCEFGLVQRHFGAESLGFLRWSAIHPHALAQGLAAGFAGVGTLADIEITVIEKEYVLHQNRYKMDMHTFIYTDTSKLTSEQLRHQFSRRLEFLRAKFFEDLQEARKIFVYQFRRALTEAEMMAIEEPIRQIGAATILFVNDQTSDWPNGHVVQSHPGRLVGYVDRIMRGDPWSQIHFDSWLKLCRNARALVPVSDGP